MDNSVKRGLWLGVVGVLLAGCTNFQQVHWGGDVPWAEARKAIYNPSGESSRLVPASAQHLVMPGDTVSGLAQLYRVPSRDLVALNGLSEPYRIYVGQVLRLPQQGAPQPGDGSTHVVASGETLSGVAAAYDVKLGDVLALNQNVDPDRLYVGTRLRLPATAATAAPRTQLASAAPARSVAVSAPPRSAPAVSTASAPALAATPAPTIVSRPLDPPTAVAVAPAPPAMARDAERQRDLAAVDAPALSGEGFLWPVSSGDVISSFGAKPDGRQNDGINIAAPTGSVVRASENGLVVYADEDLAAFGRMLLVRHADGYLTAYAHNDALLVARGDVVSRGQPIAKVGRTGDVIEPQLHFEIRRGKSAVDPVALLDGGEVRIARRD